ncbi:hypothetical protein HK405_009464 [Cladochytrium tenue]|nr:hypothetical protein HK405_009464 [Cladochytrium tenue]
MTWPRASAAALRPESLASAGPGPTPSTFSYAGGPFSTAMLSPIAWPLYEQVDLPNVLLDPHPVFFTSAVGLQHAATAAAGARPGPSPARSSSGGGTATMTDASPPPSPASSTSAASISAAATAAMAAVSGSRSDGRVAAFFASNAAAPRLFSAAPLSSSVSLRWTISLKPLVHAESPRDALSADTLLPLVGLVELRYPRQPPLDQGPPSAPPLLASVTYDAMLAESSLSRSADNYSGLGFWRHGLNRRSSQLSVSQSAGAAAASPLLPPELVICIDEEHYGGHGYAIEAVRGLLRNQFKQEAAPPSMHTLVDPSAAWAPRARDLLCKLQFEKDSEPTFRLPPRSASNGDRSPLQIQSPSLELWRVDRTTFLSNWTDY